MWGPDPPPIPVKDARRQFLMAVAGFIAFGFLVKAITPDPPAVRREYPFDGLVKELGGVEENKVLYTSVLLLTSCIHSYILG
jgi:NADH dehydrogenase (ubiquinone) 1 beta subcomplex subunit 8